MDVKSAYAAQLQSALLAGENLVWTDRPTSGIKLTARDFLLVPFSLLWGGFAIFWEVSVWMTGGPIFFKLWGIPFVLVGLYLIAGRFYHDKMLRDRTVYGITDKGRILIKSGLSKSSISTYNIPQLPKVEISEKNDGTGNVRFGETTNANNKSMKSWTGDYSINLLYILNAKKVYELVMSYR